MAFPFYYIRTTEIIPFGFVEEVAVEKRLDIALPHAFLGSTPGLALLPTSDLNSKTRKNKLESILFSTYIL